MPGGKPLRLGPFIGGLNLGSDPTAIADAELVECKNLELDIDGSLVSRPPFQEVDGHPNFTTRINALCEAVFSGDHYLIGSNSNGVFQFLNGTWTLITSTFEASCAIQYADNVYLVPHTTAVNPGGKWNPTAGFVAVAAIPKGQACVIQKERLFIAPGIASTTNTTRLIFSDPGNFDSWPGSNFIDVGQGDGTKLIDLVTFQDNLLLFKDNSTYVLSYDIRPTDAVVRKISHTIGVADQHCVINYENQIYSFHNGFVYEIINYDFQRLNTKVPFVRDTTSPTPFAAESIFLTLLQDRLVVRFLNRIYIYGLRTRTWSEWKSDRTRLHFFGPIVRIHKSTGDEWYAGSCLSANLTLIQLFNTQSALIKEQTLDPQSSTLDTFTRTVSNGWGTTDTGDTWALEAGLTPSDFSTNGTQGIISHSSINTRRQLFLSNLSLKDMDVIQTVSCSVIPTGNGVSMAIQCRRLDSSNFYFANAVFNVNSLVNLDFLKVVGGVVTTIGTFTFGSFTANEKFKVRIRIVGSTLKAKMWRAANNEPVAWTHTIADTSLTAAGSVGTDSLVGSGNTNVLPFTTSVDDFTVGNMATGIYKDIVCTAQTKNFDMAIAYQFKRLFWWGSDVISNRDVTGIATPIISSFSVTWGSLASTPWNQLQTWAQPLTIISSVPTTISTGTGTTRKFAKFNKALRFRQINFKIQLTTDGSTGDGPARLFTMIVISESKETVSKGFS